MQGIMDVMQQTFLNVKASGSYLALLIVGLYILYRINEKKNIWYILYTVLILVLVCMNPLLIYVLVKAFPVLGSYQIFFSLVPVLLVVPVAVTELKDKIRDSKQVRILLIMIVFIIGLSGSMFGLYAGKQQEDLVLSKEEEQVIAYVEEQNPLLVVADSGILPFLRTHSQSDMQLLYGRDLYQANTDLGIMDVYAEELLSLYEAMKNPQDTIQDILATAELYGCDMVITKAYERPVKMAGHYELKYVTENYLVYSIKR